MACDCIKTVDAMLEERNTRIMFPIMLGGDQTRRPMIRTEQIATGRGKEKAVGMFATYCPFCGRSLTSETAPAAGPWEVDPDNPVLVRDLDGNMIADCDVFQYTDDGEVQLEDCPANALLCSAAPNLLAALRDAHALLAMAEASGDEGVADVLATVRAAIGKAEGNR